MKHALHMLTGFFFAVINFTASAQLIEVSAIPNGSPAAIVLANNSIRYTNMLADFASYLPLTIVIKNNGADPLILEATGGRYITLTGTGINDFTVDESQLTGTIAYNQTQTFTVHLSPSATNGTKLITVHINSNDRAIVSNEVFESTLMYKFESLTTPLITAKDPAFSIYPNPSEDGHFQIQGTAAVQKIIVNSAAGLREEYTGREFTTSMKGLLIIQIYSDNTIVSQKVLVQ